MKRKWWENGFYHFFTGAVMFGKGKRWFSIGSVLVLVTAGLHTMGHFSSPPDDLKTKGLIFAMEQYHLALPMGMNPSAMDIQNSLSLTMTILLVGLGLINLLMAQSANAKQVRSLAGVSCIVCLALVVLYWHYAVFPPLVCFVVIVPCFAMGFLRAK
ncbi:MAG: hypothetical protein KDC71_14680 [Acidobacteria bacterium]|nr:hypothetical protein [Acidobacteriota bacterium]